MHGWELRRLRRDAGLTLDQVARAAGTAESNVSAYERDAKSANARTARRLRSVIAAGRHSVVHERSLLTIPALAAAVRSGLRQGWSTADLLRLVRQSRSDSRHLETPEDQAAFFAEPSTTGDARWDALLAASAEDLCLTTGRPVPDWTRGHALPTFWFVGSTPSLHAYAFARTPVSMQVRGVMIDPADLEAV